MTKLCPLIPPQGDTTSDTSSAHNGASSGYDSASAKGEGLASGKGEGLASASKGESAGSRKKFAIRKTKKDKKKESSLNVSVCVCATWLETGDTPGALI